MRSKAATLLLLLLFSKCLEEVKKVKIFFHFDMRKKMRKLFLFWEGNELYIIFCFERENK
jgi:hypothetical protein